MPSEQAPGEKYSFMVFLPNGPILTFATRVQVNRLTISMPSGGKLTTLPPLSRTAN